MGRATGGMTLSFACDRLAVIRSPPRPRGANHRTDDASASPSGTRSRLGLQRELPAGYSACSPPLLQGATMSRGAVMLVGFVAIEGVDRIIHH
jgi:hypothetical protein